MPKTVLITGGDRGIGKAIALEYASHGYQVILTYHTRKEEMRKVKKEIEEKYHQNVEAFSLDLSKEEEIEALCQQLENTSLDVLINNAAIALDTVFEDKTKTNFQKTLDVNLIGPFLLCQKIGKRMFEQKKGTIINITSTNGIDTPYVESLDYDASKAGLISLTHNLARAFAPYLRVNAIAPGWVNTEMSHSLDETFKKQEEAKILLDRFADPKEIASVAYFLSTEGASYINDSIIRVDGGVKR